MVVSKVSTVVSTMEFMEGNRVIIVPCSGESDATELLCGKSFNNDVDKLFLGELLFFPSFSTSLERACLIMCWKVKVKDVKWCVYY
jgi:hypothetical protein